MGFSPTPTVKHAVYHTCFYEWRVLSDRSFVIPSSLLLKASSSSQICSLNSLLLGHFMNSGRDGQVKLCMASSTHNYCFTWFSRCYQQPRLSLDERVMALGTLLVHQTHCQGDPLIMSKHQRPPTIKLKGFNMTWADSVPPSHPQASSPETERHRACALKEAAHLSTI